MGKIKAREKYLPDTSSPGGVGVGASSHTHTHT